MMRKTKCRILAALFISMLASLLPYFCLKPFKHIQADHNNSDHVHAPKLLPNRQNESDTSGTTKQFVMKNEIVHIDGTAQITAERNNPQQRQHANDDDEDCFRPRPISISNNNVIAIPPPKPWIHVGLPKTGTTSLEQFWKCGGLEVGHSTCKVTSQTLRNDLFGGKGAGPIDGSPCPSDRVFPCERCATCMKGAHERNMSVLESCGNYSAYAQMDAPNRECFWPQLEALERIHQEAPNATFVFLFRNVDSWIQSFQNFRRGQLFRGFWKCREQIPFLVELGDANKTLTKHQILKRFVCKVVRNARNFVAKYPSHQLLEIDLDATNNDEILSNAFGINASCWGVHNVNPMLHTNTSTALTN